MNKPLKKDEIHLSEELLSKAFQLYASEAFESITKERMQAYLMWSSEEFEEKIPCMRSLYRQGIRGVQRDLLELAQFDPELEFEQGLQVIVRRFIVYVTKRPKLFEALLTSAHRYDMPEVQQVVVDTREEIASRIANKMGISEELPMVRLMIRGSVGFVEATTLAWIENPGSLHVEQLIELVTAALKTSLLPLTRLFPSNTP